MTSFLGNANHVGFYSYFCVTLRVKIEPKGQSRVRYANTKNLKTSIQIERLPQSSGFVLSEKKKSEKFLKNWQKVIKVV